MTEFEGGFLALRPRRLQSCQQDVSPITRCVMQMVAQIERELASQRTRLAMKALRDQGKHCGSTPYGYEIVDGRLEPKPGEIEIVAKIVDLRERKMTLSAIAAFLSTSGIPTRRGGRWSAEQVRSILERVRRKGTPLTEASAA